VVGFWVLAAVLTAGVAMIVTRPLRAPFTNTTTADGTALTNDDASGLAVYRDQLAELDNEVTRGLITAEDAAAARTEISRRLLAHADKASATPQSPAPVPRLATALAAVGVPLVGLGFYLLAGIPWMPDLPRSARSNITVEKADVGQLIARVEQRITDAPDDGRGWDVIAPVYLKQERFVDAVRAYGNAIRLLGETVPRLAGLAEAHIKAANGVINDVAKGAYTRILALEPGRIEPRFWLAMALEQDGQLKQAATAYRGLLESAPPDAPWRQPVLERLAVVDPSFKPSSGPSSGPPSAPPAPPTRGPTADNVAAASQMTPEARSQMIAGMVAGLEQRLASDGRDAEGWQKLIRAYMVMGNKDKASAALRNAQQALAGNKDGLAAVNSAAKELGVGS
jgi:cytochrome c-type biogenesis protein CcmH